MHNTVREKIAIIPRRESLSDVIELATLQGGIYSWENHRQEGPGQAKLVPLFRSLISVTREASQ